MRSAVKRLLLGVVSALVQVVVLFGAAGRLDWAMGWASIGVYAIGGMTIAALVEPELIAERAKIKPDARTWGTMLMGFTRLLSLFLPLVAGLDMHLGWTQQAYRLITSNLIGLAFMALGQLPSSRAVTVNEFFSDVIRIQADWGHTVVSDGPYRFVCHPGYVSIILYSLAAPFLLNSPWALIPGGLTVSFIIVRTRVEDRALLAELDGYQEYAARVRYRLLPGIW